MANGPLRRCSEFNESVRETCQESVTAGSAGALLLNRDAIWTKVRIREITDG